MRKIAAILAILCLALVGGSATAQVTPGFQDDDVFLGRLRPLNLPAGPIAIPHQITVPANQPSTTQFIASGPAGSSLTVVISGGNLVPFQTTACGFINLDISQGVLLYSYSLPPGAPIASQSIFLNVPSVPPGIVFGMQGVFISPTLPNNCRFTAATEVTVM